MAAEPITHPLTGEVLPDDIAALDELERNVDRYLRAQSRHYQFRAQLRARLSELRPPAELPRRRDQSDVQQKVQRCPRCGGTI